MAASTATLAGQSQKEVTVNEALLLADLLLHPAVEGMADTPPSAPASGQCWIVGPAPAGAFSGKSGQVAAWSEGGWRFITPFPGLRVHDKASGAQRFFNGAWQGVVAPAAPAGGAVIDVQARAAVASLVALLQTAGILLAS